MYKTNTLDAQPWGHLEHFPGCSALAPDLWWYCGAQVLLLCMGRGPLTDSSLSLGQFSSLMLWPVLHVEGEHGL